MTVFDDRGSPFRVRRLPYGYCGSPEIMQRIVETLADVAALHVPHVTRAVHIDNVIAIGSKADVESWARNFTELCQKYVVTLNTEPSNVAARAIDFVGIHFNFEYKTVALSARFIDSLAYAFPTYQDLEVLYGKLQYAAAVLAFDMGQAWWLVKSYRRLLSRLSRGKLAWSDPTTLPTSAGRQLRSLYELVATNEPVVVPAFTHHQLPTVKIFTDATPSGFGVVLLEPGHLPAAYGASFDHAVDINAAETVAVLAALQIFGERLRGREVEIFIDNTSALSAVDGRADAARLRYIGSMVRDVLADASITAMLSYVASKDNLADPISRGYRFTGEGVCSDGLVDLVKLQEYTAQVRSAASAIKSSKTTRRGRCGGRGCCSTPA